MKTDPKITGWDVALPGSDKTVVMIYDPATQEIKEVPRLAGLPYQFRSYSDKF